jgi:hypothetical protein
MPPPPAFPLPFTLLRDRHRVTMYNGIEDFGGKSPRGLDFGCTLSPRKDIRWMVGMALLEASHSLPSVVFLFRRPWPMSTSQKRFSLTRVITTNKCVTTGGGWGGHVVRWDFFPLQYTYMYPASRSRHFISSEWYTHRGGWMNLYSYS